MILVNGAACDTVAASDRGLTYGDGVFRTLAIRAGRVSSWTRHYRKLRRDCASLALSCPDEALLRGELERVAGGERDYAGKMIITRGPGERGYAPPRDVQATRVVMSFALPQYPGEFARDGVKVRVCALRLGSQPRLAGVKHLNRLENVLARAEWNDPGIAEGLVLDGAGNVIGGTMTNLIIVERGALVTPSLARCGVAGVTRERVIEAAERKGISCHVEDVGLDRLLQAEEVLLVNSLIGAWQVRELASRTWGAGRLAPDVRKWLDDEDR
jgi:4-amino-4-deoxychorismate lyase